MEGKLEKRVSLEDPRWGVESTRGDEKVDPKEAEAQKMREGQQGCELWLGGIWVGTG